VCVCVCICVCISVWNATAVIRSGTSWEPVDHLALVREVCAPKSTIAEHVLKLDFQELSEAAIFIAQKSESARKVSLLRVAMRALKSTLYM
jgi:hypothetical protein